MKLKLDANGNVVLQDGKPVYVNDAGADIAFDAVGTIATIGRLNGEAKTHRERAEAAEAALKPFAGIEDAAAALKALDIVKNLDQKKLVDAGQIDIVKGEVAKVFEGQLLESKKRGDTLEMQLYAEKIGGSFARSKFIAEKLAIPPDMAQARFGSSMKIEDGKMVAYDTSGNKLYSPSRPGELADFDEAIGILVEAYPYKNQILKGSGASGGGAQQNNGGGGAGGKSINRAGFDQLDPTEKGAFVKSGGTVTD